MKGALNAIRYCRGSRLPLLATCGGCQYVMIEFARNVLGIEDAQHAEHDPYASVLVITPLSCSLVGQRMEVFVEQGSLAAEAYSATQASEEYYCNFGLNPEYEARLQEGGLRIVGRDANNEPRILAIPEHPFFIGTVFVPQLSSTAQEPHPLIVAFLEAASVRARGELSARHVPRG
jgi:CTP synthase (UTP-ammonia lyase)